MSGGAGYVFNYEALLQVSTLLKQKFSQGFHNLLSGIGDCNIDGEYGIEDLELGMSKVYQIYLTRPSYTNTFSFLVPKLTAKNIAHWV